MTTTRSRSVRISTRLGAIVTSVSVAAMGLSGALAAPARAANPALPPVTATVGTALTAVATVDLTSLVAPVTLSISPALPAGLAFDSGTGPTAGTISGTPTVATPETVYTVTATDSTPVTPIVQAVDVPITVDGVLTPPSPIVAIVGQPIPGSPTFSVQGLGSPVSFAAPTAPAWLSISAAGVVSGTPDVALPDTAIPVTATDGSGAKATATLNVAATTVLTPATQTVTAAVGTALSPVTTAFPTSPTTTYEVTPSLSTLTGLTLDPATGVVSGTPTHPIVATAFTIQQKDSGALVAQSTITVTVDGLLGATALTVAGTVGSTITPFSGYGVAAATAAGLTAPLAYTTTPDLPGVSTTGDLTINGTTGVITGRPTSATAAAKFTVNVVDKNGIKASGPIVVTIAGSVLPSTQSLIGSVSASINSRTLTASGMTAPVSYSISPALPGGLLLNAATGVVSGIPRAPLDSTPFDITATDANGAKGTAKLTLSVSKALLNPPIIGSISGGVKAGSLQVIFTKPALAPVGQTYTVLVYDSTGSDLIKSVDTTSSPVIVDGLVPGETYQIVIVANATASYERVESLPKPGIASMTTTTSLATTTSTSAPVAATVPAGTRAPSALSRAGIALATAGQAASAKRVLATTKAARSLRKAPLVRIPLKVISRVVLPGVVYKGLVQVRMRLAGVWVPLGTARASKGHRLGLPAFSATKAGTYPIQVVPSSGGRAVYVSVAAG